MEAKDREILALKARVAELEESAESRGATIRRAETALNDIRGLDPYGDMEGHDLGVIARGIAERYFWFERTHHARATNDDVRDWMKHN